ncbi:MAG: methyltransferase domain-containing protein [Candidatus Bathyarchaeota archaeon]|nr:methyltransferase domain-containing protein [Candidatus Bathyarchaeota archaeon]
MPTSLFISGKNWILSLAELTAYFKTRNINCKVEYFCREFFAINTEQTLDAETIKDLGGTIKIGNPKTIIPTQTIKEAFLEKNKSAQKQISQILAQSGIAQGITGASGKLLFGVSVYFTDNAFHPFAGRMQRFIGSALKDELAEQGKKSSFMGYSDDRKQAQLSHVEVLKKNLVENHAEILFCIGKTQTWVATTIAVHNPFEFQKRDVYKPNQRVIFAMPPRLARMMVNLSACKKGKVLLDPFCGVGTILQEALLEQAVVVGMDVNSWCVKASEENLQWLAEEYELGSMDFRVIQGDVDQMTQKIGVDSVDCVVCEPDLGPALREVPTGPYAQKIIEKLEPLFFDFVEQAYQVLKPQGRLVLVTPYIKTRSNEAVTMPIADRFQEVGFKRIHAFSRDMFLENLDVARLVASPTLIEMDERHKIGREIHILEK